MKVLLLNTADRDGGAARAAQRLHQGLDHQGLDCQMWVQSRTGQNPQVRGPKTRFAQGVAQARLSLDALPLKRYPQRQDQTFSVQWVPDQLAPAIAQWQPDVINLHWINEAFVRLESLAQWHRPLVWTLHDMWPFTGGCHYAFDCDRYTEQCGQCPQLGSDRPQDLSHQIWQRKAQTWKNLDLTVVTVSHWLADCARRSSLFGPRPIEVIANGIDTELYRPIDRQWARQLLQLPQDKALILFGAVSATGDRRKGFHLLQPALQRLCRAEEWRDRLELVVFGSEQPADPPDFGTQVHYLGSFRDDLSLALVYAAADLFVLPSLEENLANTIMEALACGTPCVAFKVGGMPDLIEHERNGYLAQPYDIKDLAQGLAWVLSDPARRHRLSARSREKVLEEFTQARQAQAYKQLFRYLLSESRLSESHQEEPS